jgi:hypothetical protein
MRLDCVQCGQGYVIHTRPCVHCGSLLRVQPMAWIPVDSAPLPVKEVLCAVDWYGEPQPALGTYCHEDQEWFAQGIYIAFTLDDKCTVTHWQPLPELPDADV